MVLFWGGWRIWRKPLRRLNTELRKIRLISLLMIFILAIPLSYIPLPNSQYQTYVVLSSPSGGLQQSASFVESLRGLGIPFTATYLFTSLGSGAVMKMSSSAAEELAASIHPYLIFRSTKFFLNQENIGQPINLTWSYFPNSTYTGSNVTVALIDTGVNSSIPALQGKVIGGYNFVENNNDTTDTNGHGTAVASIIASNSSNFKGVAPEAKLLVYKIFRGNETTSALVVEAMDRAASDGAKIINLSLGGALDQSTLWKLGYSLLQKGILLVASAGNDGPSPSSISSPAGLPPYLAVGASTGRFSTSPIALLRLNGSIWLNSALTMLNSPLTNGTITAGYEFVGSATPKDVSGLNLSGKIAVAIRDHRTTFTQMDYDTSMAGAIALIVINDQVQPLQGIILTNGSSQATIPAVAVSLSDGDMLMANKNGYLQLQVLIPNSTHTSYPATFSSLGPNDNFTMKPDILAEGDMVPALSASGTVLVSGTSFSAPQVAGALALLVQEHPSLTAAGYYSLITMGASKLSRWNDLYPSYIQGAGELNITSSLTMPFYSERSWYLALYPSERLNYSEVALIHPLSQGRWSLSVSGPYSLLTNVSSISFGNASSIQVTAASSSLPQGEYDDYLIFSSGSISYSLPVLVFHSSKGGYVNYTDYTIHVDVSSWKSAQGNITSPDGTVYELSVSKGEPISLLSAGGVLKPGYYEATLQFFNDTNYLTVQLSFYIEKTVSSTSTSIGYYPYYVPYYIAAYAIILVILTLIINLVKRIRRGPAPPVPSDKQASGF